MSSYRTYRGQSFGRVLHAFSVYLEGHGVWTDEIYEKADNKYTCQGELLATFLDWEGEDVPVFKFENPSHERLQYIKKPFLDNPVMLSNIMFTVQEVRKIMTFDDALYVIWIRDKWKCDWNGPIEREGLGGKIRNVIAQAYHDRLSVEHLKKYWKHFALCAVYGITDESNTYK